MRPVPHFYVYDPLDPERLGYVNRLFVEGIPTADLPGGMGTKSGGAGHFAPPLMRAAFATIVMPVRRRP